MVINAMGKKSQIGSIGTVVEGFVAILDRVVRAGLIEKTLFEQRYKARERDKGMPEREGPV